MTVPITGEPPPPLLMLIPTRPGVAGIVSIGKIASNEVVENLVVDMSSAGESESRTHMGVQCDTAQPIVRQSVPDDHIPETRPWPAPSVNNPDPAPPTLTPLWSEML